MKEIWPDIRWLLKDLITISIIFILIACVVGTISYIMTTYFPKSITSGISQYTLCIDSQEYIAITYKRSLQLIEVKGVSCNETINNQ